MSINQKLLNYYGAEISGNKKLMEYVVENELYGPLLMSSIENHYDLAKYKILIIGQEAGWLDSKVVKDNVSELLEHYTNYKMASKSPERNSPFWRAAKTITQFFKPDSESELNYLWTNVSKYSDDGGPIAIEMQGEILNRLNLLPGEIEIIQPDLIVFFSGPNYDQAIQMQFDNQVKFKRVNSNIPEKEFAQLTIPNISDKTKIYRTYHPRTLQQQQKWFYLDIIGHEASKEFVELFKAQLHFSANELKLHVSFSDNNLGESDSGFYFTSEDWNYCKIGFSFERGWMKDLFYGLCRKDLDIEIPLNMQVSLKNSLGKSDEEASPNWPFWKWYKKEQWNNLVLSEISISELTIEIKKIIEKYLIIVNEIESIIISKNSNVK